jgi:Cytochrome C oxidase, cbb3-type, subunit III
MRGVRRSLAWFSALVVFLACEGGRESGAPPAGWQTTDTAAASRDTAAAVPDTARDTASAPSPAGRDIAPETTSVRVTPRARSAAKPSASKPAAPPAPAPTMDRPDSAAARAETPAEATQTPAAPAGQASAPLRDQYHQAPRDTVTPEVYDGWKQYNLNCARCHGEDVLGTTIAPHLIVSVRPGGPVDTKEAFIQTVCAGRPEKGMPAWCPLGLGMDKINAIYLYVKGRSEGQIGPGRPARRE